MAESIVVEYGGKRMPVTPGLAEKDVKALMARFFPELADPKIEKKKEGDVSVWTFSKQAGKKGAGPSAHTQAAQALLALETVPVVPLDVVEAVLGQAPLGDSLYLIIHAMREESALVASARLALADLPAAAPAGGDVL